jgi:hypothetical protein
MLIGCANPKVRQLIFILQSHATTRAATHYRGMTALQLFVLVLHVLASLHILVHAAFERIPSNTSFVIPQQTYAISQPYLADYDQDGDLDVAYATINGGQSGHGIWRNDLGSGTQWTQIWNPTAVYPTLYYGTSGSGSWCDLDNDRDLDWIIAWVVVLGPSNYGYNTMYALNNGAPGWNFTGVAISNLGTASSTAVPWLMSLSMEDLDNDGTNDLLLGAYYSTSVWELRGFYGPLPFSSTPGYEMGYCLQFGPGIVPVRGGLGQL